MGLSVRCKLVIAVLSLAMCSQLAGEGRRVRLGSIGVNASYVNGPAYWGPGYWGPSPYWGPSLYRPWGPAWWDPWWYNGWAHPGYWNGFAYGPGMGEVKLSSSSKEAMVYLDGAYAGPVSKLKSMWLEPGVYNLEVREDGTAWEKRIYVLSGKTMQLRPELKAVTK